MGMGSCWWFGLNVIQINIFIRWNSVESDLTLKYPKLVDRPVITVLDCSSYLVIARITLGYPRDENTSFLNTLYDISNIGFISGSVFGNFDGPSPTCGRCR